MTTSLGAINVKLFQNTKPISVGNFIVYANSGDWDGTFFHRSAHLVPPTVPSDEPFVIQAGGFKVKPNNTLDFVTTNSPIKNEPGISNTRGTIAYAKVSGGPDPVNSATNQFFFNERNNSGAPPELDTQNGGFTVFGTITNASGLAVMDAIGGLTHKDLRSNGDSTPGNDPTVAMDDAPVINPAATPQTLNPSADLVVIRRVAILNKLATIVLG
jgi:cyclophilin family peptidyl-prolyl cis-trans isomerase